MVTGLPCTPAVVAVTVTEPSYVPAGRFEPFTAICTVAGAAEVAFPLAGVAVSQPTLACCCITTLVVKAISVPLVETVTCCGCGAAVPSVCEKDKVLVGVTVMVGPATVMVTGTVSGLSSTPEAVAVIVIWLV